MAAKKSMKESHGRKWSEDELKEFASVLADDRTEFALTLETLALKKSANVHIFETINKELDACLQAKTTTSSKSCYSLNNLFPFRRLEVHFWHCFNSCPVSSESRA